MASPDTFSHIYPSNLNTKISKTPFAKVIKLPQMLGYSKNDSKIVFSPEGVIWFWKQMQIESWSPNAREYSTWTFVDGSLVQFGGLNSKILNDTNILDFRTYKWTSINLEEEEYIPEPRYGHSAVAYGSYVIIYGGYRRFLSALKTRDTYGDISIFDTDTMKWDKVI